MGEEALLAVLPIPRRKIGEILKNQFALSPGVLLSSGQIWSQISVELLNHRRLNMEQHRGDRNEVEATIEHTAIATLIRAHYGSPRKRKLVILPFSVLHHK